nr:MBOAT family O-acyltransferase [uncultured Oscillibacter sp.]
MAFHSAPFLFFFLPAVCLLSLLVSGRGRIYMLVSVSLAFYACGQWQGLPCLLLSAAVSCAAGFFMPRVRHRRALLTAVLAFHLLLLGAFKYLDFFTGSLNGLLGTEIPAAGLPVPLGVSFFTFKSMSYAVDVYRDEQARARRFSHVLLYIAFFPQAVSGPISRFGPFIQGLESPRVGLEQAAKGLRRFIAGFAKKALISELAATAANAAFALGNGLDFRMAWLGAAAYTLQIYFDFSGYSDMAIGLGTLLGFTTPENFDYPYISASITEFWRRWHLSLSLWFRDYLYIPLGGGRRGTARKCLNKAVVFLLCGLWHGASWTFVLWGAWHGLLSALESALPMEKLLAKPLGRWLGHIYTLLAVCVGFVVFRAASVEEAATVLRAMFTGFTLSPASTLALARISPAVWCALGAGVIGSLPLGPWLKKRLGGGWLEFSSFAGAAALFVLCLLAAAGSSFQPFIYAQF